MLLPENTLLGLLEIVEVYEYFDMPCLFSCVNRTEQTFLAVWVEEEEAFNEWLYLPVSTTRLVAIQVGAMDLRNAFLSAEDKVLFKVRVPHHQGESDVVAIACQDVPLDYLPDEGEFLQLDSDRSEIPDSDKSTEILLLAQKYEFTSQQLQLTSSMLEKFTLQKEANNLLAEIKRIAESSR